MKISELRIKITLCEGYRRGLGFPLRVLFTSPAPLFVHIYVRVYYAQRFNTTQLFNITQMKAITLDDLKEQNDSPHWPAYVNFSESEMGGPMSHTFMLHLQNARTLYTQLCRRENEQELGFIINSGHRTEIKNQQVGGKPDSTHLFGIACDIKVVSSRQRFLITKALLLAGFTRLGLAPTFIHVDMGDTLGPLNKSESVLWFYS